MTYQNFRTRSVPVRAMRFEGDEAEARRLTERELGREVKMPYGVPEGGWLLIDDMGGVTALPDIVFQRCYLPTSDQARVVAERPQSCFDCENYAASPTGATCMVYNERIDSELISAKDCPSYTWLEP